MKYVTIEQRKDGNGDVFCEEFETPEKAIARAEYGWDRMSHQEKKIKEIFVLESANPDEEAPDHLDGDPIWHSGTWYAVMTDRDDTDWGYGSHDLEKAKEMAKGYGPDAYIAVIQEGDDPICVEEISQEDF